VVALETLELAHHGLTRARGRSLIAAGGAVRRLL
jgi:hypothetical protein